MGAPSKTNQCNPPFFLLSRPSLSFLPSTRPNSPVMCVPSSHTSLGLSQQLRSLLGRRGPSNKPHSIIFCCRHKPPRHLGVDFYARSLFLPYLGVRTNLSFPPVRPYKLLAGWLAGSASPAMHTAHCTAHRFLPSCSFEIIYPPTQLNNVACVVSLLQVQSKRE